MTKAKLTFLVLPFLVVSFFLRFAHANNFNVIKLSCEFSGDEVSLNTGDQPGPRLRKYVFPGTAKLTINRIVYISDGRAADVAPLSYEAAFDVPVYEERLDSLLEAFQTPIELSISRARAQTTVFVSLSRENIVDLLDELGSKTAETFNSDFSNIDFNVTRYFPVPEQLSGLRTSTYLTSANSALLNFTGIYGNQHLETCYQIDPSGFSMPDMPLFNQISYHVCGRCKVNLLESSATAFEPRKAN